MTTYYTSYYDTVVKPGELFPAAIAPWDIDALADGTPLPKMTTGHKLREAIDLYRTNAPSDDPHRTALHNIDEAGYAKRLSSASFYDTAALRLIKDGFCYAVLDELCVWSLSGIRFGETVFRLAHYDPNNQLGYSGCAPAIFKDLLVVHAMLSSFGNVVADGFKLAKGVL